jgi:hypothetical protein
MDVDGVLNPFPHAPRGYEEHDLFPGQEPVRLRPAHGAWLRRLARDFDLVWATAWGEAANRHLCPVFGLPALPVIEFPPVPFEPREKVPAIRAYVGDRAVAWIDDVVTREARAWATSRAAPTLLIDVDPATGLAWEQGRRLGRWHTSFGQAAR